MQKKLTAVLLFGIVPGVWAGTTLPPSDVVTVGTISTAAGTTVNVPVYIRDTFGSALGIDQPVGSRIQSYTIKVNYAPASSVSAITFTRGGITTSLTPSFESSPSSAGTVSLIDTFAEATNLIPFTLNGALPGNQIGILHVTVAAGAPVGAITLTVDPAVTVLSNQAGTTSETSGLGSLVLVSGAVNVTSTAPAPAAVPTLSSTGLALLGVALVSGGMLRLRRA